MLKSIFIAIFLFGLLFFQYILAIILVKRSENIVKMVQEIQEKVDKPIILEEAIDEESIDKEDLMNDQKIIFEKELKFNNNTKEIEMNIDVDLNSK